MKLKRTGLIMVLALVALVAVAEVATRVIGNSALTNKRLVSAKAAKLYTVMGQNTGPAQFVQVFATNALPPNDAVPVFSFAIGAGQYFSMDFGQYGADLDAVYVVNSTTTNTLTLGSSNVSVQAILGR